MPDKRQMDIVYDGRTDGHSVTDGQTNGHHV